jgi:glutathione peroxidase
MPLHFRRFFPLVLAASLAALGLACSDRTASRDAVTATVDESTADTQTANDTDFLDTTVTTLDGEAVDLGRYRGKPLLIVNTASKCGYTPQYEGLQTLYERYGDRGLVVLGFPSPDFADQEFETGAEIKSFCQRNFGVTFPLFARGHVKGPDAQPLFRTLTEDSPPALRGEIQWNFTKFLIGADGQVLARFEPPVDPLDPELVAAVEAALEPALDNPSRAS